MANRIRNFIESIVYAGMKPAGRPSQDAPAEKPGWLDRWLNAPAPNDPLYLTNQTFGQKARRVLRIAAPLLVVAVGIAVAVIVYRPKTTKVVKELTPAEVAAKTLPAFNKEIKVETNRDVQVLEVHFEHAGRNFMVGSLKNMTSRRLSEAVVVFDLADIDRSQLGGVTVVETNVEPGAVRDFKLPIEQATATYAVVREVRTQ